MQQSPSYVGLSKPELYRLLIEQLRSLLEGEADGWANAANMTALLYQAMPDVNWVGFYRCVGEDLVLGPFQGRPACTRIALGKGVCGTAAVQRKTMIVPNVHQFPGHIACDSASLSELVTPLVADGRLLGVFDVDSPVAGRFDAEDQGGIESLAAVFLRKNGDWLRGAN